MKSLYGIIFICSVVYLSGCAPQYQTVAFEKKRTPLNPIAHKGVVNYKPKVTLRYAVEPLAAQKEYEEEVARRQQQYNEALEKFNNATIQERILQGLTKPRLILPDAPDMPYIYNEQDLENRINIEGMNKGDVNPLEINITYNGYNVERVKVVKDKKKRKVDGVEYVDTVYYGRADVKHPLMLYARSPIGSDYAIQVPQTDNFKTLKTSDYSDSAAARKNIVSRIEEEEKTIGITNLEHVNRLLNSQFGTQDIQYFVNIYTFESTSKNDYSDLQEASLSAQLGLKLLNTDPNSAYEKLNKAYSIWSDALNEYSPGKKARINDKVKKGILLNLTAVSIFTENWEGALKHITELENMKLSSAEKGELNRLRGIYRDLKSRYDALAQ